MKTLTVNDKTYELDYTFNSFKYMEDLDMSEMADSSAKPVKMIKIMKILLLGALNCSRAKKYSEKQVEDIVEAYVEEGSVAELMELLTTMLGDCGFFKSLQK